MNNQKQQPNNNNRKMLFKLLYVFAFVLSFLVVGEQINYRTLPLAVSDFKRAYKMCLHFHDHTYVFWGRLKNFFGYNQNALNVTIIKTVRLN